MMEEKVCGGEFLKLKKVRNSKGAWEWVQVKNYKKSVVVLPLTKDGKVVVEKQYRYPVRDYILGLPSGLVENGEIPEQSARRELEEETGYVAKELKFLFTGYVCPGLTDMVTYYYYAPNVVKIGKRELEPLEDIEVLEIPSENLLNFLMNSKLKFEVNILSLLQAVKAVEEKMSCF